MKIIKQLSEISEHNVAVTIGNFDGVHIGHRAILNEISEFCRSNDLKFLVITFAPHPMQIFSPQNNFLINSYDEKRNLLKDTNVDYLMEVEFNRDLSTMNPSDFMEKFIVSNPKVKHFFVGHDFAFGANKSGDHKFVQSYCKDKDIDVHILTQHKCDKAPVSSSVIRGFLDVGDIPATNKSLGRSFYISGRVIKGEGRGRRIGIPTANLSYADNRKIPKKGVYITKTKIGDDLWHSITNIGNNPTFNDTENLFVETHIFDFDNDIYGSEIEVFFYVRLRDEKKFNGVNELIDQIKGDISKARDYFKNES